jgi:hypothetical protein
MESLKKLVPKAKLFDRHIEFIDKHKITEVLYFKENHTYQFLVYSNDSTFEGENKSTKLFLLQLGNRIQFIKIVKD